LYILYTVKDVVRIPPEEFGLPLEEAARRTRREKYEGIVSPELGVILAVTDVEVDEVGKIVPGDGATYHNAVFRLLAFNQLRNEVVEGPVVEVKEFGIFVRIGPIDGLVHRSQITDDYMEYEPSREALIGKETRLVIEKGDIVRARIASVSIAPTTNVIKVGLTMRQPYLGKLEWIKRLVEKGGGNAAES
jgi:DNA-directed RNA polymerase subunit E'